MLSRAPGPTVVKCFPQVHVSQRMYSSRTCGTNANNQRSAWPRFCLPKHTHTLYAHHTEGTEADLFDVYLFVQQTVDNEEEGALLGVEDDEEHLEEEISLVQTQNPGAAQYDELGHDLEQNHSAEEKKGRKRS